MTTASTPDTPERSGRQEGDVAGQERDRHLERRVVDAEADEADHPSDQEPDRDPTEHGPDEVSGGVGERERAGDDRSGGEPEEDERGAVVDEALALDDRDRATRDSQSVRDRRRGDRVGRGDDGAEHESARPRKADHVVGSDGDRDHRRGHEADRE